MNVSVKVLIPKHLGRYLNNKSEIDVEATDLKAALEIVTRDYQLEDILLTREGHLQAFIHIVIDDHLVTSRKAEDMSRVAVAGKTVEITAAIAGG
jgi:hypothetical protein